MKKLMIVTSVATAAANSFGAIRAVTPDMRGGNTNSWLPPVLPHFQKICGK